MKDKRFYIACLALCAGLFIVIRTSAGEQFLSDLTRQATLSDPELSTQAIHKLREAGPAGLGALFEVYSNQIAVHTAAERQPGTTDVKDASWEKIRTALDEVGLQRDCYASHLFWYTNLDEAEAAAHAAGKPILSLRLLGKLNEEYSCANSRFFRTTLYTDTTVSQFLRDHFILHWQSERPVPRITIDMGDGRKIDRTITGNSVHYILDANGRPVDALPGLYDAKTFVTCLTRADAAALQCANLDGSNRESFLKNYHADQLQDIQQRWAADLARFGIGTNDLDLDQLNAATDDATWQRIAAFHYNDARFSPSVYRLVEDKMGPQPPPTAEQAAQRAISKSGVENPMLRAIFTLERSISADTVHNEYQLHSRICQWWAQGNAPQNLAELNRRVYAQIFLTPASDPWLGLVPPNTISALDHNGLVTGSN